MRDYNHRNQKGVASQRNTASTTALGSNQGNSMYSEHSIRPVTPDGDGTIPSSSVQTSPGTDVDDQTPVVRSVPLNPLAPYTEHSSLSAAEYRLSRTLNPAALKRVTVAMEEALKEIEEELQEDIEEEADDEIVMPRSPPLAARSHPSSQSDQSPGGSAEVCSLTYLLIKNFIYYRRIVSHRGPTITRHI